MTPVKTPESIEGKIPSRKTRPVLERFYERTYPEPNTGCWLWDGIGNPQGYGYFHVNGRNRLAHRVSYILHVGVIPKGVHALHRCDNPACVNPDHLFLGSQQDNVADMIKKGRYNNGKMYGK